MNTYKKYCPNVFVAKCDEKHKKGDVIELTTKYGKIHECEVHNFLGYLGTKEEPRFLYSITRCDGFNAQERAKKKAEKLQGYASNAEKRSDEAYNSRASKHELDFMSLGEPIKIGHHSEKRHRKLFEKYDNKMRKSMEESEKAKEYLSRAEYWESKANDINLSMPESLEYYEIKLHQAKEKHQFYKDNPDKREHSYSLTYAKKAVNENKKNLEIAVKLWGDADEIALINKEKEEEAQAKASKKKGAEDLIKKYGGFFHFGSDKDAFEAKYQEILKAGHVEEGEKVQHVFAGLYIPVKNVDEFLKESKKRV